MEFQEHKMKVKIVREFFYSEENYFGMYACVPTVKSEKEKVKLNDFNNFSLRGSTRPLKVGNEYVITFDGLHPNKNPSFDDYYEIKQVEPEKLDNKDDQDRFLQAVITERQFNILKEAYPDVLLVDFILEDKIDVRKTKGIKESSLAKIKEQVQLNSEVALLIAKLDDLSLSTNSINRIMKHFKTGQRALDAINKNIYSLCAVQGYGFLTVDKVALRSGVSLNSPMRIQACIKHVLNEDSQTGHTWMSKDDFFKKTEELLQVDMSIVNDELNKMSSTDVYIDHNRIALAKIRRQEIGIHSNLERIHSTYVPLSDLVEERLNIFELSAGFTLSSEQREAVLESYRNGVSIVNGSAGGGKCIVGDSLVLTDKGLIQIEDIPEYFQVNSDNTSKANVVSYELNGSRKIKETSHFFNMGRQKTIKIKSSQGYEIEGTPEHPIIVVNKEGELEFKKLSEVINGEVIAISRGDNLFGNETILNKDLAYLLGLITGDGYTNYEKTNTSSHYISFTNGNEKVFDSFLEIYEKEFGVRPRKSKSPIQDYYVTSISRKKDIFKLKHEYDLSMCLSNEKEIPKTILTSPKNIVSSFLMGLFDTDGSFHEKRIEFSTASKKMANQLQVLLLNYGIISKKREKIVKKYLDRVYYIIDITCRKSLNIFQEEIGFLNEDSKKSTLKEFLINSEDKKINPNIGGLTNFNDKIHDIHQYILEVDENYTKKNKYMAGKGTENEVSIRHYKDKRVNKRGHRKSVSSDTIQKVLFHYGEKTPHYDYFSNVCDNLFIDYVSSIEESESVVYDFTVPETHSFVANGIINHNTTIIKAIIETSGMAESEIITCALSGKASNVLSSKGMPSGTIHRVLGFNGEGFAYDSETPLPYELIIVDESSMVDVSMFLKLLQAIKSGSRLVIVGDSFQLSCVGYGDILQNLIETPQFDSFELKKIFRQGSKSGVLELATKIRNEEYSIPYNASGKQSFGSNGEQAVITYSSEEKNSIMDDALRIISNMKDTLNDEQELLDFQVLVPNRESGRLSAKNMNIAIQEILNDMSNPYISRGGYDYREGDKVIANGNVYEEILHESVESYYESVKKKEMEEVFSGLSESDEGFETDAPAYKREDVFNGTLGIIRHVDVDEKLVFVQFENVGGLVVYKSVDLDKISLAYAITIHRSQGSQYSRVLICLDFSSYMLLTMNLVYTAITRSSDKCVLLAENNALNMALSKKSNTRRTFLKEFLSEVK